MTINEVERNNIKALFRRLDHSHNGYIHRDVLRRLFQRLCHWKAEHLSALFNTSPFDRGDGYLEYEGFLDWLLTSSEVPRLLVGTFNMLGDGFNPFEFLALDDPVFMEQYAKLRDRSQSIQWADLEPYAAILSQKSAVAAEALDRLKAHCASSSLWSFFTEKILSKDNKLLAPRINLITFAMKPVDEEDLSRPPIWKLNQRNLQDDNSALEQIPWFVEMLKCIPAQGSQVKVPYLLQPNLLLWDLTCNITAMKEWEAHFAICSTSYLHPDNYESIGQKFLNNVEFAVKQGSTTGKKLPVILGFQEWPSAGTTKATVMTDLFKHHGFSIILGPFGTALGYRGDLGCPTVLTERGEGKDESFGGNSKRIDAAAVMNQTIASAQQNGLELDDKLVYGLVNTTARKTLAVLLCSTIFMVVHAKEPKTEAVGELLAKYCQNVIKDCQRLVRSPGVLVGESPPSSRSWLVVVDTNIGKSSIAQAFRENISEHGGQVVPGGQPTTSKHRSILHGQCYDTKKCNVTVTAPKDHIVAPEGCLADILIQPEITEKVSLPSPHWGSDHSLLTAVYCMSDSP